MLMEHDFDVSAHFPRSVVLVYEGYRNFLELVVEHWHELIEDHERAEPPRTRCGGVVAVLHFVENLVDPVEPLPSGAVELRPSRGLFLIDELLRRLHVFLIESYLGEVVEQSREDQFVLGVLLPVSASEEFQVSVDVQRVLAQSALVAAVVPYARWRGEEIGSE